MPSHRIIRIVLGLSALSVSLFFFPSAHAAPYTIESLPDKTVYDDFVVGPGKYQLDMKPGETKVVNVIVTNRLGKDKTFQIQTEDFTGSRDIQRTVVLLDDERGPYSLKDYLAYASSTFTLHHAERATLPITVTAPTDAQPGGLYGSVVIGTITTPAEQVEEGGTSAGVNPVITRIGSLFFIRIEGEVKRDLILKDFSLRNHRRILSSGPVDFQILYENNGTIHENPYGDIRVTNIFGSQVADVSIEPWFVLPDSVRLREISWQSPFLFGRYVAEAELHRGYASTTDTLSTVFWVIPWKIIVLVFIGLVIIITGIRWIASKFTISIKK